MCLLNTTSGEILAQIITPSYDGDLGADDVNHLTLYDNDTKVFLSARSSNCIWHWALPFVETLIRDNDQVSGLVKTTCARACCRGAVHVCLSHATLARRTQNPNHDPVHPSSSIASALAAAGKIVTAPTLHTIHAHRCTPWTTSLPPAHTRTPAAAASLLRLKPLTLHAVHTPFVAHARIVERGGAGTAASSRDFTRRRHSPWPPPPPPRSPP